MRTRACLFLPALICLFLPRSLAAQGGGAWACKSDSLSVYN